MTDEFCNSTVVEVKFVSLGKVESIGDATSCGMALTMGIWWSEEDLMTRLDSDGAGPGNVIDSGGRRLSSGRLSLIPLSLAATSSGRD